MRICEVCGLEEEMEFTLSGTTETRMLHICDNCQNDRKFDDEPSND